MLLVIIDHHTKAVYYTKPHTAKDVNRILQGKDQNYSAYQQIAVDLPLSFTHLSCSMIHDVFAQRVLKNSRIYLYSPSLRTSFSYEGSTPTTKLPEQANKWKSSKDASSLLQKRSQSIQSFFASPNTPNDDLIHSEHILHMSVIPQSVWKEMSSKTPQLTQSLDDSAIDLLSNMTVPKLSRNSSRGTSDIVETSIRVSQCKGTIHKRFSLTIDEWFTTFQLVPMIPAMAQVTPNSDRQALVRMLETWKSDQSSLSRKFDAFVTEQARTKKQGIYIIVSLDESIHMMLHFPYTTKGINVNFQTVHIDAFEWTSPVVLGEMTNSLIIFDDIIQKYLPFIVPDSTRVSSLLSTYGSFVMDKFTSSSAAALFTILMNQTNSIGMFYGQNVFVGTLFGMPITPVRLEYIQRVHGWSQDVFMKQAAPFVTTKVANEVFEQEKTHKHKRPYTVQGTLQWRPNYDKKELTINVKGTNDPYTMLGISRFITSMVRFALNKEEIMLKEQSNASSSSTESSNSMNNSDFDSDDSFAQELAALKRSKEGDDIVALKKELMTILRRRRKGLPQQKVWKNDVMRNKIKSMFDLMGKSKEFGDKSVQYTRTCQNFRQPILLDNESDWKEVNRVEELRKELFEKKSRAFHYALHSTKGNQKDYDENVENDKNIRIMLGSYVQICPLSWCLYDNLPVSFHDYESTTDVFGQTKPGNTCPYCHGTPLPFKNKKLNHGKQMAGKVGDTLIVRSRDENMVFPGFNVPKATFDICLPCCFKKPSADKKPMCRTYFQVDTKPANDTRLRGQALAHASNIQPPILAAGEKTPDASSGIDIEIVDPAHIFQPPVTSSKSLSNILTETKIKPGQFAWLPKPVHSFLHSHELDKTFVLRKGPTSELQPNIASYVRLHSPITMNGFHNLRLLLPSKQRESLKNKNDMISFLDEKLTLHSILFCPFMIKHLSVPFGMDIMEDRYAYLGVQYGEEIARQFSCSLPSYEKLQKNSTIKHTILLIDYIARVKESLMSRLQDNDVPMSYIAEWCSVGFPWIHSNGVNVMVVTEPESSGSIQLRQFFPLRNTHQFACFVHDRETQTYHPLVWVSKNGAPASKTYSKDYSFHVNYKGGRDIALIRTLPSYLHGYFTYEPFLAISKSQLQAYMFSPNGDLYGYMNKENKKSWNVFFLMEYSETIPIRVLSVDKMRVTMTRILTMDHNVRNRYSLYNPDVNEHIHKGKQLNNPKLSPFISSFIRSIGKDKQEQKQQCVDAVRFYNGTIIGLKKEVPLSQVPPTETDRREFAIEEQYVYRGQLVEQPSLGQRSILQNHVFFTHAYHDLFEEVKHVIHTYLRNEKQSQLSPIHDLVYSTWYNYYEKYDKLYPKISALMKTLFVPETKQYEKTSLMRSIDCISQTSSHTCNIPCKWSNQTKECKIPLPEKINEQYHNLLDLYILRLTHMLLSDQETREQVLDRDTFAYAQSKYAVVEYTFQRKDIQAYADGDIEIDEKNIKDIVIRVKNINPEEKEGNTNKNKSKGPTAVSDANTEDLQPTQLETIDDVLFFVRKKTDTKSIDVANRLGYRDIFFSQFGKVITSNGITQDVWNEIMKDMAADKKQSKQLYDKNAFKAKQFAVFIKKYIPCNIAMFTCVDKPNKMVNLTNLKSNKSPLFTIAFAVDPKGHAYLLYDSKRNTYINLI